MMSKRINLHVLAMACVGVAALAGGRADAAVWDGGAQGTGNVLGTASNWVGDVTPADGEAIVIASSLTPSTAIVRATLYLNGGTALFVGTTPSKSFPSMTFGTDDAATTKLSAATVINNGITNFLSDSLVRLTGDATGNVLSLAAGATSNTLTFTSGTYGVMTFEFAGATPAQNGINVAAAASRITVNPTITGTGGLSKNGAGAVFINGLANSFSGDIYVNAGQLGFGYGTSLSTSTNTTFIADGAGASLDSPVTSTGDSVAAIHTFSLSGATSRIAVGTSETWTVNGAVTGAGGLTKTGAGVLILAAPSTFVGATTVSAGGLFMNAVSTTSGVTVATGATFGGTAVMLAPITVSGTLSPGASAAGIGTLVAPNVTLQGSLAIAFATDGLTNDLLAVTGSLDITGGTLAVTGGLPTTPTAGTAYVIATYGALAGTFSTLTGITGYDIDYHYNNTNAIALVASAVPEPTMLGVVGLFSAAVLRRRR